MSKRILGRDLEVSSIGLGCMGMSHAYGRPSDKTEAKNLLAKAVDLGYTMFDTAEVYGTAENPHHNETLLGEILKPYRNQIKIATKGGLHFDENSTVVNKNLVPDSRPEVLKKSPQYQQIAKFLLGRVLVVDHIDHAIAIGRKYKPLGAK